MAELPDLTSLRLLAAVARLGSLGRAAAEAGMTQPSASVRMRNLERRLGVTLLERDTRGSRLTPAGELVVGWAAPILSAAGDLMRGVMALRTGRGSLSVAASLTVAEYLLPGWLARWQREHPDQAVRLRAANSVEVIDLVQTRSVQLGFVETPRIPATLDSVRVASDRIVVVVAPGHPWADPVGAVSTSDLRASPLLLRERGSGTRETFERALGSGATSLMELSTTSALRGAALAGAGAAVISELAVRDDIADGQLLEVPVAGLDLGRELLAVWPRGDRPSGPAAALLEIAGQELR